MVSVTKLPAPSSAEARATKVDRVKYLEAWADENPLATIEAAREAVRLKFGISLGTKIISDTLRMARQGWETKRKAGQSMQAQEEPGQSIQQQINTWVQGMKALSIRLVEILDDGKVRVEFTPS